MTATVTAPTAHLTAATTAPGPDRTARLAAGIGAVGFATVVLATNAVVGATPAWNASVAEVATFVNDKHDQLALSVAGYAIGMPFLVSFIAGIATRLRAASRREDRVIADIGLLGAVLILPFFAAVVLQRIVMTVGIDERVGGDELLALVWRLEGAAFALNMAVIGVAVFGIGTAASRAGLLPKWFRYLAVVGGVASIAGTATGVAMLEGAPVMPLGLVGFASWMVLLLTIGVRQLRAAD
jgi:hypothetical protein